MATMHYLLFGILSVPVFYLGGFGDRTVTPAGGSMQQIAEYTSTSGGKPLDPAQPQERVDIRDCIVHVAVRQIGVREATDNNDGVKVEEYLAYTGLGKGHAWCAAFVSWCYGQAGLAAPRNAWSPALFPMARRYTGQQLMQGYLRQADLFAIYNRSLGRIDHVGIVRKVEGSWIVTVEGNVDNRVLSKRRRLATIYTFSNWLDRKGG